MQIEVTRQHAGTTVEVSVQVVLDEMEAPWFVLWLERGRKVDEPGMAREIAGPHVRFEQDMERVIGMIEAAKGRR